MSRKNFLSTDFFVSASEKEARNILLSLPGHLSQLTLLKEDTVIHSTRFLFDNPEKGTKYYVDVTVLQLNDQYVRFSLHGSYTNGQAIQSENEIRNVLAQFEKLIFATANNDFSSLYPEQKRREASKKSFSIFNSLLSLVVSKYHY
ncbi:MAG: hypothetical protein EOO10_09875 [Chitinophagaceae bacterium]|nr:MAG: hypothetical protein EOO10_09875 [Chitinophagaceae bacterium]